MTNPTQSAPAAPSVGEPTSEQDETKPLTDRERELIMQRCRNHEAGHDTGLTSRAVLYLYGYEALVSALRSSLEEARKDSERLKAGYAYLFDELGFPLRHRWGGDVKEFREGILECAARAPSPRDERHV